MTADLGEENSIATVATERLEVEQSERMKLEKERGELLVSKDSYDLFYACKKILASLDIFDSNESLNGIMLFTQKYMCGKKIECSTVIGTISSFFRGNDFLLREKI